MARNVLQMRYHAAKKEVGFRRFQDGEEIEINPRGALSKYVNMKGNFVLQDFGNTFFSDIAKVFDAISSVEIEAIMTKLDYEDLVLMIENCNRDLKGECEFIPTLLAELPDMEKTFEAVKQFGEEAVGILGKHRSFLFDLPMDNEDVRQSVESYAALIDEEVRNIKEKISSLQDNTVSLCFTGVYSAGKSALINALLGYRILPEDVESKTAKMFRIYSPQRGKPVRIIFELCSIYTILQWNAKDAIFEFKKGPSENPTKKEIQKLLNHLKKMSRRQDEQIIDILDKLNGYEMVSSEIKVEFPIPLDRDAVQFTIYDTPGTDSNVEAHQSVLTEALKNQTQSILIFVAKPDGLEGAGNNALLNYLKDAEKKNSKTSIDISRSLFVINKVDGQTSDARKTLQHQEIKDKEDGEFTIKLEDKKLFFTSALYGCVAKSVENGTAHAQEQALLVAGKAILATEGNPMSFCFRENRYATSEFATNCMIQRCESALQEAITNNDDAKMVGICSGMYALETEILQYGEKYAAAVKAFAIIDSVNKALTKLNNQAYSLRESNQDGIARIEQNIRELTETINVAIEYEYEKRTLSTEKAIPEVIRKKLKIDSDTLNRTLIGHTESFLNSKLKKRFLSSKVKFRQSDKAVLRDGINGIIADFTRNFMTEREKLLTSERDQFIDAVKKAINENGNISEAAKSFFQDIPKPAVGKNKGITNVEGIYDANRRTDKVLFWKQNNLDKKAFINDIKDSLQTIATEMADDYAGDYRKALETILMAIKSNFEQNLAKYSLYMKAMIDNRDEMKQLGEKISLAVEDLTECESRLNDIIWREE